MATSDFNNFMYMIYHFFHFLFAAYVQDIGRSGRDGRWAEATLYYNASDIAANVSGLTEGMRGFCTENGCRRVYLNNHFGFESDGSSPIDKCRCCDNCAVNCECPVCDTVLWISYRKPASHRHRGPHLLDRWRYAPAVFQCRERSNTVRPCARLANWTWHSAGPPYFPNVQAAGGQIFTDAYVSLYWGTVLGQHFSHHEVPPRIRSVWVKSHLYHLMYTYKLLLGHPVHWWDPLWACRLFFSPVLVPVLPPHPINLPSALP